tara:strand:+ start:992 stop:1168 length:177 start_codon:yes stop_codon:yes gene_type:complete
LKETLLKNENFISVDSFTLVGNELLNLTEKPTTELLLPEGERWNRKWSYLLEPQSNRI